MFDLKNNKRKAEEYNMIFPLLSIHCQDKTALEVEQVHMAAVKIVIDRNAVSTFIIMLDLK